MYTVSKPIPQLIGDIIDTIRKTGTITDVVFSGHKSTVTSDNTLRNGEYVKINDVDYQVSNVTTSSFQVVGNVTGQTSWKALAPYYEYGHMLEITQLLAKKDKAASFKGQKYPLIALSMDFEEDHTQRARVIINPTIYIINETDKDYYAKNRIDNVFIPILYPVYEDLIDAFKKSTALEQRQIKHRKTDRVFWGKELPMYNSQAKMNDYIDAIELNNVELKFITKQC
jgi:hypothetical protein